MDQTPLNKFIDHTLLKPTATETDFRQLFTEAVDHDFFSVCIPPQWVSLASRELKNSPVSVCTVVGFPLGYNITSCKVFEADRAVELGADELDMVANLTLFKSKNFKACEEDIREVVRVASGNLVKVILETCYLNPAEIADLSKLCEQAGAQFVKTSTGFASGGATLEAVKIMRESVGEKIGVKASGGIRDRETAMQMISAGANRLGTSQSIAIVSGETTKSTGGY